MATTGTKGKHIATASELVVREDDETSKSVANELSIPDSSGNAPLEDLLDVPQEPSSS